MDHDLREQLYNNLNLRETDDLLEIWQENKIDEWDKNTFEVIREILLQRLGTIPPQSLEIQARQALSNADGYLDAGDLDQALSECESAIEMAPDLADAYNTRGMVYDEMEQLEKALADYQKAIQLDPELQDAWDNLESVENSLAEDFQQSSSRQQLDQALEHGFDDELEQALEACKLARESLPDTAFAHNYLGMTFEALEQLEPAVAAYLDAITFNPRFYAARENLANASLKLEIERYRQAALEEADQEIASNFDDLEAAEIPENAAPAPGWIYLDEKAFVLTGWPGHRTRPGRSGFDPLETDFELAHMEGVMIRLLLTRKFRTHNPVYLLLMACIGLIPCSALLLGVITLLQGNPLSVVMIIIYSPYWVVGIALLANVYSSLSMQKPAESIENGNTFF